MTDLIDAVEADRALKARHRAMWALGDYPSVAAEIIPELGPILVEACEVRRGDRVMDIAAGSGNVAIPAALAGASVVACDLEQVSALDRDLVALAQRHDVGAGPTLMHWEYLLLTARKRVQLR